MNRLSERFGAQFVTSGTVLHAFPMPTDLADVPEESIREPGFSHQKARAMKELSTHVADTSLDVTRLEGMANREAIAYLSASAASVGGLRSMCSCEGWVGWTPFRATTSARRTTCSDCFTLPIGRPTSTLGS